MGEASWTCMVRQPQHVPQRPHAPRPKAQHVRQPPSLAPRPLLFGRRGQGAQEGQGGEEGTPARRMKPIQPWPMGEACVRCAGLRVTESCLVSAPPLRLLAHLVQHLTAKASGAGTLRTPSVAWRRQPSPIGTGGGASAPPGPSVASPAASGLTPPLAPTLPRRPQPVEEPASAVAAAFFSQNRSQLQRRMLVCSALAAAAPAPSHSLRYRRGLSLQVAGLWETRSGKRRARRRRVSRAEERRGPARRGQRKQKRWLPGGG